jgi:hypothetical protein
MKPVNNKSMIAFLFGQMDRLDRDEIDVTKAREQSNLAKQVNNSMKYELDRVKTKMEITKHNNLYNSNVSLRDVESKGFE